MAIKLSKPNEARGDKKKSLEGVQMYSERYFFVVDKVIRRFWEFY